MQTAEPERSDPGLVGLIVRCRANRLEPVLVLLDPLPPGAIARVRVEANNRSEEVAASLVPTGAGLALTLPLAERLATGWRNAPDLTLTVETGEKALRGVVRLQGLAPLLPSFEVGCRDAAVP